MVNCTAVFIELFTDQSYLYRLDSKNHLFHRNQVVTSSTTQDNCYGFNSNVGIVSCIFLPLMGQKF